MKKEMLILTAIYFTFAFTGTAQDYETETGKQVETDMGIAPVKDISDEGKGPTYSRALRDIEREYQEGSLTRTEYIQRKRELNDLYK